MRDAPPVSRQGGLLRAGFGNFPNCRVKENSGADTRTNSPRNQLGARMQAGAEVPEECTSRNRGSIQSANQT